MTQATLVPDPDWKEIEKRKKEREREQWNRDLDFLEQKSREDRKRRRTIFWNRIKSFFNRKNGGA